MSLTVPGFRALADRAVALAEEVCDGRLVAILEGGYSLLHLPLANLAIVEALAGLPATFAVDPVGVDAPLALRDVERAAVEAASTGARGGGEVTAAGPAIHDAHGWWIADAGSPAVLPALEGDHAADVVVVGGGYTGLWAAWHVLAAEPDARVVVLEAGRCGHGPSGRNGGFVTGMALSRPTLIERFGGAGAPRRGWRPPRRPCGPSAPGARRRASTPGTGPAASSSSPPRPPRTM